MTKGRLEAFSDGVLAIVITIMVLELRPPEGATLEALAPIWPRLLAYVLSFLVIARFWVTHHLAFRLINRYDATLVWLNLLLLMFVSFLPFPTAVLGEHEGSPAAAVLYGASVCLAGAASAAYWWYASGRGRLLRPDVGRVRGTGAACPRPERAGVLRADPANCRVCPLRRGGGVVSRVPPDPGGVCLVLRGGTQPAWLSSRAARLRPSS